MEKPLLTPDMYTRMALKILSEKLVFRCGEPLPKLTRWQRYKNMISNFAYRFYKAWKVIRYDYDIE